VAPLGAALAGLLLAGRHGQVVAVLRYLMLGFAAVGVAAVLAHPDWPRLLTASLVPARSLRPGVVTGGLALLGTTLTSCLQVWETIGLGVEEPSGATAQPSGPARAGTVTGAVFTAVILWFMLVAATATLGRHHHAAASAQDAARALRPPYDHPATGPRTGRDWHRRGAARRPPRPARRQDRQAGPALSPAARHLRQGSGPRRAGWPPCVRRPLLMAARKQVP
jgi:hypothetical protein